MTRPTVSSRIVGTPDDRKSALSVVMSGIRKPNPITIPAASMAWTTMLPLIIVVQAMLAAGIREPNPITIPAASVAWTTMTSGSLAPVVASDQRSNDRNLVQRLN